VNLIV